MYQRRYIWYHCIDIESLYFASTLYTEFIAFLGPLLANVATQV